MFDKFGEPRFQFFAIIACQNSDLYIFVVPHDDVQSGLHLVMVWEH